MAKERLHRDEVDGCIVLIRMAGDRWLQSPSSRRLGVSGFDATLNFVRVRLVDEERIEPPEPAASTPQSITSEGGR